MNKEDSFLSFLEDSLEVPDLGLAHETRHLLLSAAGGMPGGGENVIPFVKADPAEQTAFDWLAGERPVDLPLMELLTNRPGFAESMAAQKQFIRLLRKVLRPATGAPEIVTVRSRKTAWGIAGSLVAAVTLLMAFSPWTGPSWRSGGTNPMAKLAEKPGNQGGMATAAFHASARVGEGLAALPLPSIEIAHGDPQATPTVGLAVPSFSKENDNPGVPSLLAPDVVARLAASEVFGREDSGLPMLASSSGAHENTNSLRSNAYWEGNGFVGSGSWPDNTPNDIESPTVPEPSGIVPVLIGVFFLCCRRRRNPSA